MEACGSAHHWARKLKGYGHTVKLKAPQFVKPYVKTNKNDMADAEAICEAVDRPNMRFVAHKNVEQQAITASAIVATVGDAREFKNGRQLAAWFGLVPKQHSSGGKQTLLGISKRGDTYLRTLLIHGARAVLRFAEKKAEPNGWLIKRMVRRNKNVAAVALANKNARIIWALLTKGQTFRSDYATAVAVA